MANYPRWWGFPNVASENSINLGQFEEGLKEGQISSRLQPDAEPPYRRLLDADLSLDRLDDARKVAQQLRTLGIGAARIHQRFLEMAYIEEDQSAAATEIQWYAGKPEEYLSFGLQAAHQNVAGQRRESSKLYKRATDTALRQGLKDVAAGFEEADARADALSGNCTTVRHLGRPALGLALCGDVAGAERLAAENSRRFPNGVVWNAVQLPEIRAVTELQRGQPAYAIELLAPATPYERAYPEVPYIRGLAYLRLHMGAEAAAEFHKVLDHKGTNWASTWRYPHWDSTTPSPTWASHVPNCWRESREVPEEFHIWIPLRRSTRISRQQFGTCEAQVGDGVVESPVWVAPCASPIGSFVVEDFVELGCGLGAHVKAQICEAADVGDLGYARS